MTKKTFNALLTFVLAFSIVGIGVMASCRQETVTTPKKDQQNQESDSGDNSNNSGDNSFQGTVGDDGLYTPAYKPQGDEIAVFETSKGKIKVQLDGKDCPITVGNFIDLVQRKFYDGTRFHRYEPNFVIQGGDPDSKNFSADQIKNGDSGTSTLGQGGPGYKIKGEYSSNPNNQHNDGALAMARSNDPDSGGSQFYFCLGAQHNLDSGYTVFGQTIEGLDVIKLLEKGDEIISITIENLHQ